MSKDTLSLAEAAALTGKCVETIYRLVRARRIPATKDADGNWRIERRALCAYYTKRSLGKPQPQAREALQAVAI